MDINANIQREDLLHTHVHDDHYLKNCQKDKRQSSKVVTCLCKISFIANVVLFITLSTLFLVRHIQRGNDTISRGQSEQKWSPETMKNTSDKLCIPCDDLGDTLKAEDTIYDEITKTECGHRICCVKNKEYLHDLIRKMVNERYTSKSDSNTDDGLGFWRNRSHAAHLYLDYARSEKQTTWLSRDITGTAFSSLNLTQTQDRIVISKNGLYFVYAAFSFDFTGFEVVPQVYHNITKQHPLLKTTGPRAELMTKYGGSKDLDKIYTSFLCGIMNLQKGYEIATHASNFNYLDKSNYAHYFGLFRL